VLPNISKSAVSALLVMALGACGQASVDDARRAGQAAQDAAAEANARVADLEATTTHLEDVVARLQDSANSIASDLEGTDRAEARRHERVLKIADRLWKSVGRLREAVDENATTASERASSLARDIAVLTKRFDYHLKHSGR
jgi:chromosome segregation ATPase